MAETLNIWTACSSAKGSKEPSIAASGWAEASNKYARAAERRDLTSPAPAWFAFFA
jgi:hypothetical protein